MTEEIPGSNLHRKQKTLKKHRQLHVLLLYPLYCTQREWTLCDHMLPFHDTKDCVSSTDG